VNDSKCFSQIFLRESAEILRSLDTGAIEALANALERLRMAKGRLFVLGVGGSAAHASHAVNDFRKICGIEAYAPTDNISELTARINDDGWKSSFSEWLKVSNLCSRDAMLILSVSGADREGRVSPNLAGALELGRAVGSKIYGIVGRDGGLTRQHAEACVLIPPLHADRITAHTEGLCSVILHLLVSHPSLSNSNTRGE
jgi:D-sedoheptulose 7-phosphate isomerase